MHHDELSLHCWENEGGPCQDNEQPVGPSDGWFLQEPKSGDHSPLTWDESLGRWMPIQTPMTPAEAEKALGELRQQVGNGEIYTDVTVQGSQFN